MNDRMVSGYLRPRPNKDNIHHYDVILELGRDKHTGKRIRKNFNTHTNDRVKAEAFLMEKKLEYFKEELLTPSKMTVADYLEEFLQYCRDNQYSSATVRDYSGVIKRYLNPVLGKIKLQDLSRADIQNVYSQWRIKSNLSGKPLKANSIRHIHRILKTAMNEAVNREYIKQNPAIKIKIPKDQTTNKLDVYTIEEIHALQKAVKNTDMELPVALLFDCVLRRGELLGLRFSDIDFDNSIITIRHSLVEAENSKEPVLKDCKTDDSYREMVVTNYTMKLLKKQLVKYKENKLKYGKNFHNDNFVICQEDGKPFLPKSFTRKWARTLEKYGLRHIKLHGTRHSAISMLLSENVPLHMVQQRAGHKDPKVTLDVYSHIAKDKQTVVAEKLDEILFSAVNE